MAAFQTAKPKHALEVLQADEVVDGDEHGHVRRAFFQLSMIIETTDKLLTLQTC